MTTPRLTAIIVIFIAVSAAWMALAGSVSLRTSDLDSRLSQEMASLWGPKVLAQATPFWSTSPTASIADDKSDAPAGSTITADIRHEYRNKGLLWYSTFTIAFRGEYRLSTRPADAQGSFIFPLPAGVTSYDNLSVMVDDKPYSVPASDVSAGSIAVPVARDAARNIIITYTAGGQDQWLYVPGTPRAMSGARSREAAAAPLTTTGELSTLRDFKLTVTTDFAAIDYPAGSRSPVSAAVRTDKGMKAVWQYDSAITSQPMGVAVPRRTNAGPIAARMSFFAPVSLAFFFCVLFMVAVLKKVPLHPMHYLFIAAGFFAFHILLAYLADVIKEVHVAFWISAAVSVFLVASYMRLVSGTRFTLWYVSLSQLVFLVGFSYAFFWEGYTGLTVTILAVLMLFLLMQATARVDWSTFFKRPPAGPSQEPAEGRPWHPLSPPPVPLSPQPFDRE